MALEDIILTTFLTVIAGTLVFVLGQFILRLFIEPFDELMKLISKIEDNLIFYANVCCNPGTNSEKDTEAGIVLRSLSTQLIAKTNRVIGHKIFEKLRLLPKRNNLLKAHQEMIGLSNSVHTGDPLENQERRNKIERLIRF